MPVKPTGAARQAHECRVKVGLLAESNAARHKDDGKSVIARLRQCLIDERGATAIEYGLIVALISVTLIAAFAVISGALNDILNIIIAALTPDP